jgi:DNA-directed RNA polymerase subunit RPC12/RpoP
LSTPPQATIRFNCPRCGAGLKAPPEQAGSRHHCPACGAAMVVPGADRPGVAAEWVKPVYVSVVCDVCGTRMYATEDQLGREVTCPDCFAKAVVRRPAARPEVKKTQPHVVIDEDEYRLCPGVDQPPPGSRAYERYFPVICPVCSTRMLATLDQVGQKLVCPDCTIATIVPPPPDLPQPWRPPVVVVGENEYRIHEGIDQPPPGATFIPVVCSLCGTRMYAAEDQAGREIVCPDCQTRNVVPALAQRVQYDPMAGADEGEYRLGRAIEAPEIRVGVDYRSERNDREGTATDRVRWHRPDLSLPAPRWTFFSGVFTFPCYAGSLACWIVLSLGLIVVLPLGGAAIALSFVETRASWIGSMLISGLAFTCFMLWVVAASAYLLAILRDTANGHDAVENWPDAMFLDWLGDSYFVFSSLAISMLPGVALARGLQALDVASWPAVPLSMLLLFPVLLVSMLETNSPLRPFSLPVLGSLLTCWWAWGMFYAETTLLMAATIVLVAALTGCFGPWGALAALPAAVGSLMIYFRLLGRVTWRASGAGAGGAD